MAPRLQVLILGIGDFFTRLHYNTSFVILPAGQEPILVDCPCPLRKILFEAGQSSGVRLDSPDIKHLILTHLHGDHCNGVEELAFYKYFTQREKPALYTMPEVLADLWDHRLKASLGWLSTEAGERIREQSLEEYFEVREWEPGRVERIGGVEFEIRRTKHYVPCFGFRLRYEGVTLAYSSDTIFDPEHIAFLNAADFIIHETNGEGHTRYDKLLTIDPAIKRKIRLIHISDEFDVAKAEFPVLEQGRLYDIG